MTEKSFLKQFQISAELERTWGDEHFGEFIPLLFLAIQTQCPDAYTRLANPWSRVLERLIDYLFDKGGNNFTHEEAQLKLRCLVLVQQRNIKTGEWAPGVLQLIPDLAAFQQELTGLVEHHVEPQLQEAESSGELGHAPVENPRHYCLCLMQGIYQVALKWWDFAEAEEVFLSAKELANGNESVIENLDQIRIDKVRTYLGETVGKIAQSEFSANFDSRYLDSEGPQLSELKSVAEQFVIILYVLIQRA